MKAKFCELEVINTSFSGGATFVLGGQKWTLDEKGTTMVLTMLNYVSNACYKSGYADGASNLAEEVEKFFEKKRKKGFHNE